MLGVFYIVLLSIGLAGFVLHLVAQFCVAHILRRRYPQQWDIVSASGNGRRRHFKTFTHLQRVLRSSIPEMFNDNQLIGWHRCWRFGPWLAWPCLIGALALRTFAH